MKKMNLLLAGLLFCANMVAAGCDKSTDLDDIPSKNVPQAVMSAFKDKYPKTSATWEMERGMMKAEFRKNGKDVDAWFENNGTWVRSETDLVARDLPQVVKSAVQTQYPDYRIDDADLIETPSESYYLIELEKKDSMEIKVKVTPEGTILS